MNIYNKKQLKNDKSKTMNKIETLRSITTKMKMFDLASKESDYITVTEWSNGEGWDICINDNVIQISRGELEAINFLTTAVDRSISIDENED